jgi:hypothetical protein
MTRALFRFTATPDGSLDTNELTIPLRTMAGEWFDSPESAGYGSQFSYRQAFTFPGRAPSLGTVSVQVENTIGASDEFTVVP